MRCASWVAACLVIGLGAFAPAALADPSDGDNTVHVSIAGAIKSDLDILTPTLTPTFSIQVLQPDVTITCQTGDLGGFGVPCGTPQTTGCPAVQCWTYSPAFHGDNDASLTVFYTFLDGPTKSFDFLFTIISKPPDTKLAGPTDNPYYGPPSGSQRPQFDITPSSSDDKVPVTTQCTLWKAGTNPGPWGSCKMPRLDLLGVYNFRARAVDIFHRPDPTPPPPILFSPTPCRATAPRGVHDLRQIVRHGLKLTVKCIGKTKFETDLVLPNATVRRLGLPSGVLGFVKGQSTKPRQTLHLTLHTLRGLPAVLFTAPTVTIDLPTTPLSGYGAIARGRVKIRG